MMSAGVRVVAGWVYIRCCIGCFSRNILQGTATGVKFPHAGVPARGKRIALIARINDWGCYPYLGQDVAAIIDDKAAAHIVAPVCAKRGCPSLKEHHSVPFPHLGWRVTALAARID